MTLVNDDATAQRLQAKAIRDAVRRERLGDKPAARPMVQRLRSAASLAFGLGLFLVSLWVMHRWLSKISLAQLLAELAAIPVINMVLAVVATFASFATLAGYEFYAIRYVGKRVARVRIALYAFITQSIAHAVGFALVVGASIRYKLYARYGLTVVDIAKIQVFFTTTFGLGALTLVGSALLLEPGPLARALDLPHGLWRATGAILLLLVVAFVIVGAYFRRPIPFFGQNLGMPETRVVLIQIVLGVVDLMAVALALHLLLPPALNLTYLETLGMFVAAVTVGLASHIPGSLGVFESTMILLIRPGEEMTAPVIGALIAFRAIYYILPLILGSVALGIVEVDRLAQTRRRSAARSARLARRP